MKWFKKLSFFFIIPALLICPLQTSCNGNYNPKVDKNDEYYIDSGQTYINAICYSSGKASKPVKLYCNEHEIPNSVVIWNIGKDLNGSGLNMNLYVHFDATNRIEWTNYIPAGKYIFPISAIYKNKTITADKDGSENLYIILNVTSKISAYIKYKNDVISEGTSGNNYSFKGSNTVSGSTYEYWWMFKDNDVEIDYSDINKYTFALESYESDQQKIIDQYFKFNTNKNSSLFKQVSWKVNTPPGLYKFKINLKYTIKAIDDQTQADFFTNYSISVFIEETKKEEPEDHKQFSFTFDALDIDEYKSTYKAYYSNDYFKSPSTIYNQQLSTLSMSLTMASANRNFLRYERSEASRVTYYTEGYYFQKQMLEEKLKFENFKYNDWYMKKPSTDSIGVCAATKKMSWLTEGQYTLIALPIRSAGYGAEWASNMTLGDGNDSFGHAKGFYDGAIQALEFLKNYIASNKIIGRIKLWVTGFSRGGAVSNIIGGLLDTAIYYPRKFGKSVADYLGNTVSLASKDLYVYTFEAPQGANNLRKWNQDPKNVRFNNIFNIINPNDLVPKVPPWQWGFTRYGKDLYTSASYIDDSDYLNTLNRVLYNYNKYGDYSYKNYLINNIRYRSTTGSYIDDEFKQMCMFQTSSELIYDLVSYIGTREKFVSDYQSKLREAFNDIAEGTVSTGYWIALVAKLKSLVFNLLTHVRPRILIMTLLYSSFDYVIQAHLQSLAYSWCLSCDTNFNIYDAGEVNSFKDTFEYYQLSTEAINQVKCYTTNNYADWSQFAYINGGYFKTTAEVCNNCASTSVGVYVAPTYAEKATIYFPSNRNYYFQYSAAVKSYYSADKSYIKVVYFSSKNNFEPLTLKKINRSIGPLTSWYTDLSV